MSLRSTLTNLTGISRKRYQKIGDFLLLDPKEIIVINPDEISTTKLIPLLQKEKKSYVTTLTPRKIEAIEHLIKFKKEGMTEDNKKLQRHFIEEEYRQVDELMRQTEDFVNLELKNQINKSLLDR